MSNGSVPIVSRFASQPEIVSSLGYIINEISKNEIKKKFELYFNLSIEEKKNLKKNILDYTHDKFSYDFHLKKVKKIFENFN